MSSPKPGGVLDSARRLASSVLAFGETRLALFAADWEEAWIHVGRCALLGVLAVLFGALGVLMATAWTVALFWSTYRLATLGGLALLYFLVAGLLWAWLASERRRRLKPFAATLEELKKDRETVEP